MTLRERDDLLVLVASLYYEHDYSQQQIADQLKITRSNISRLLKEAKQKGFVEIRIHKAIATVPELERELVSRFGLRHAMVVRSGKEADTLATAGKLAAQYLEAIWRPRDVLAISWGTGVAAAVAGMNSDEAMQADVVQMMGSVGAIDSVIDGPELARQLATKLGGRYTYLHAPLFLDSEATRNALVEQPTIGETLERARGAHVALVGIGTTQPEVSSFLRAGHLTEAQLAELHAQGVVGETVGQHFDLDGNGARFSINRRVMGLSLDELKRIPYVVAVACGLAKKRAILGALRGGLIKALATDDETAQAVIEEAER